jgi:hypothetical protein
MNALARNPLVALLLALCTACASDRAVIDQAADAHRELEPAVIDQGELANYIQELGHRVVDAAHGGAGEHAEEGD